MDSVGRKKWRTISRVPGGSLIPRILLLVFLLPGLSAVNIIWLPNLEWNTESNWADSFVPKNGSHIVFPVEMRLSVGLPIQYVALDIAGLELPRDGAIGLPESGFITISKPNDSTKTAEWSREGPLLWADPNNWLSEKSSQAVPHLERIPCQDDIVVLPAAKRTFNIQMPITFGTKVQAIRMTNDTGVLPSWEWGNLRWQREFSGELQNVEYSGLRSCLDCTCQSRITGHELLREVCETPGGSCRDLACTNPVSIEGHCCQFCGARLVLSNKTSLSLAKRVADMALKDFDNTLSWYARRTWNSDKEILIAGKKEYSTEKILEGIVALTSTLQEQGIKVMSTDTTGSELGPSQLAAAFFGPFLGMLLLMIVLLLVAFSYYGYPVPQILGEGWNGIRGIVTSRTSEVLATVKEPTLSRKSFGFAKFENTPESEVELAASSSNIVIAHARRDDEGSDDNGGGRFANPLYRSGRREPETKSFAALQKTHDDTEDEEVDLAIEP